VNVLDLVRDEVAERAFVVLPILPAGGARETRASRDPAQRLAETVGLTEAIGLRVEGSMLVKLERPHARAFIGSGKVEELRSLIGGNQVSLVIFDETLSPVQQRNLERSWQVKVLDRIGLILEIFGRRAKTREGRLQVELAHLEYQRSRLVRSWTHLGRQRGGFGFLGGPGETQIESDRRNLRERIARIKVQIDEVRSKRRMHRSQRKRSDFRSVALVGYTNAGKSTLFNRLTGADVESSPMLFATLDPTVRSLWLPQGTKAVISDTVGFISDLPTTLVAAFRATLEEVTESDLILHVRDIANPETEAQREDVRTVLRQIGLDPDDGGRFLEVWNKVDQLDLDARSATYKQAARPSDSPQVFVLSAHNGSGVDALRRGIEKRLMQGRRIVRLFMDPAASDAISWLYSNAEVLDSRSEAECLVLTARMRDDVYEMFSNKFQHDASFSEDGQEEEAAE
jgi:GTP-binding protein HflX